jgi:hypothetical protein
MGVQGGHVMERACHGTGPLCYGYACWSMIIHLTIVNIINYIYIVIVFVCLFMFVYLCLLIYALDLKWFNHVVSSIIKTIIYCSLS